MTLFSLTNAQVRWIVRVYFSAVVGAKKEIKAKPKNPLKVYVWGEFFAGVQHYLQCLRELWKHHLLPVNYWQLLKVL